MARRVCRGLGIAKLDQDTPRETRNGGKMPEVGISDGTYEFKVRRDLERKI